MTWHATDLLPAYRDRSLDAVATASVDAHLVACAQCRTAVAELDDPSSTDALWLEIVDEIDCTAPTALERLLGRLGVPDALGRLIAATPGLVLATALSAVISVGFGLFLADTDSSRMVALFVGLAAVVPAVSVAASFGAAADPAFDVAAAAPLSGLRLVFVRTVAVEVVAVAICLIGALGHLDHGPVAVAWLLPGLALAATTLALSTWTQPWTSVGLVAGAWLTGVALAGRLGGDWLAPFGPPTQVAAVVVLALAGALAVVRSPHLDHREV